MARKPNVTITTPGKPAHATETQAQTQATPRPADDRIALTLKVSQHDYERLMVLKGRRREPVQRILERAVRELLDGEGV